jgi:hypothetical protein
LRPFAIYLDWLLRRLNNNASVGQFTNGFLVLEEKLEETGPNSQVLEKLAGDQEFVGKLVMGTFTQALDKRVNELDEAERAELEELRRKQNEAKKGFFRKLFG